LKPTLLLAPDSFKGSLTARRFCEVAAAAVHHLLPEARVIAHPLADGGEGTLDVLSTLEGARFIERTVTGPIGEPVEAGHLHLADRNTAVIEMARASGLLQVPSRRRRPLEATTRGTGELLVHALEQNPDRIVVTLGGSATTDAGSGCLQALGYRFLDTAGRPLPPGGGALVRLARIEPPPPPLGGVELLGATDVTTPLTGPTGAARMFAPQKGATPEEVARLEAGLVRFAEVAARDLGLQVADIPGAGAAGGLGAGLLLLGARLVRGFSLVAELTRFEERFTRNTIDLVITGEGRLDGQSAHGKVPVEVAKVAARHSVPVVAVAGEVALSSEEAKTMGFDEVVALAGPEIPRRQRMAGVERLLAEAVRGLIRRRGFSGAPP